VSSPHAGVRDPRAWHVLVVLAASAGYESLFLHHGLNLVDEGWPLYAAMQLHAGGTLYDDVFFVFPPGHLAVAWIAWALDPPGVVLARSLYASFTVALCVGLYLLGRRLMPPGHALFGSLLLAVGATSAHLQQNLFGYRYLVSSLLALWAFDRWLGARDGRWIFAAGLFTGLSLVVRIDPAFAAGCAIALGVVAAGGSLRSWLRAFALYALGIAVAAGPVIALLLASVGPETLWFEVVVRPVVMTAEQSLPIPPLTVWPGADRKRLSDWFVALQFRAWLLLYAGYALGLSIAWLRAVRARRPFPDVLLLAVAVWGGVYFIRTLGRSDSAHLYSALPPVCLLLGHAASLAVRSLGLGRAVTGIAGAVCLMAWIYLGGGDRVLDPAYRGDAPLAALRGEVAVRRTSHLRAIDRKVAAILERTQPGDRILDLSASPLLHVLTGRRGPGYADLIMPGAKRRSSRSWRAFRPLRPRW
jgi:hypothetical protein